MGRHPLHHVRGIRQCYVRRVVLGVTFRPSLVVALNIGGGVTLSPTHLLVGVTDDSLLVSEGRPSLGRVVIAARHRCPGRMVGVIAAGQNSTQSAVIGITELLPSIAFYTIRELFD